MTEYLLICFIHKIEINQIIVHFSLATVFSIRNPAGEKHGKVMILILLSLIQIKNNSIN